MRIQVCQAAMDVKPHFLPRLRLSSSKPICQSSGGCESIWSRLGIGWKRTKCYWSRGFGRLVIWKALRLRLACKKGSYRVVE